MFNSNNIDLSDMFNGCTNLVQFTSVINLSNRPSVGNAKGMFNNCISLTSFSFTHLYFDYYSSSSSQYSCSYYYRKVNMAQMFYSCTNLRAIDTNNSNYNYNFGYIANMKEMFYNCASLTSINLNNFMTESNDKINLSYMFYNCKSLTSVSGNFNKFEVSDTKLMFYNCNSLVSLDFYPHYSANYLNMTKMFYNCNTIRRVELVDVGGYFHPNDMSFMFYNCYSLINLAIKWLYTDYTEHMIYMFYNCTNLNNLTFPATYFYNNLVKDMRGVFQNCKSLISIDLSNFYSKNIEIMWDIFKGCSSLQRLSFRTDFDTSEVTDMQSMFNGCSNLVSLDLSRFKQLKYNI